eukprot:10938957-Alexandrium_andersonii.AAC.1
MPQCSKWQRGDCQRGCRIATKGHRGRQHRCRNCGTGCPRGCRVAEAPWVNAAAWQTVAACHNERWERRGFLDRRPFAGASR